MITEYLYEIFMTAGFLLVVLAVFLPTGEAEVTEEGSNDI